MVDLVVEYVKPGTLTEHPDNPKSYSKRDIEKMMKLIERFEYIHPLKVTTDGTVIDGNRRLRAAKKLGLKSIPVIRIPIDNDKALAYILSTKNAQDESMWVEDNIDRAMYDLLHAGWNLRSLGMENSELKRMEKKYIGRCCPRCKTPIPDKYI